MSPRHDAATGYENLRNLVGYIQRELCVFRGLELPIISILLRLYPVGDGCIRVNVREIAHLSQMSPENSLRLLRSMAEQGVVRCTPCRADQVEVSLTGDGRNLVGRLISAGVQATVLPRAD